MTCKKVCSFLIGIYNSEGPWRVFDMQSWHSDIRGMAPRVRLLTVALWIYCQQIRTHTHTHTHSQPPRDADIKELWQTLLTVLSSDGVTMFPLQSYQTPITKCGIGCLKLTHSMRLAIKLKSDRLHSIIDEQKESETGASGLLWIIDHLHHLEVSGSFLCLLPRSIIHYTFSACYLFPVADYWGYGYRLLWNWFLISLISK